MSENWVIARPNRFLCVFLCVVLLFACLAVFANDDEGAEKDPCPIWLVRTMLNGEGKERKLAGFVLSMQDHLLDETALLALVGALSDKDDTIAGLAMAALARSETANINVLEKLAVLCIKKDGGSERVRAIYALSHLAPRHYEQVFHNLATQSSDPVVRYLAADAVHRAIVFEGESAWELRQAMEKIMHDNLVQVEEFRTFGAEGRPPSFGAEGSN